MNLKLTLFITLFSFFISSCEHIPRTKTSPVKYAKSEEIIIVTDEKDISLSNGYSVIIAKMTSWKYIGDIPEGKIYKPLSSVFMVEDSHKYQAYLVLQNHLLVGFYLPASKEFSNSLNSPIKLNFKTE